MNNPVFLSGLNKIYSKFDIFFVDLWGVVHNGIECYSDSLKALKNIKKRKKIILISNAPRPSHSVQKFLNKINLDKKFYNLLIRASEIAKYWEDALHSLKGTKHIIDIRNLGLIGAIELEPIPEKPSRRAYNVLCEAFRDQKLFVRVTGDIIALSPSLIIQKQEIDLIVEKLKRTITSTQ